MPELNSKWRRKADGVVVTVVRRIGGSHNWVVLRRSDGTGKTWEATAEGLRRKYEPVGSNDV